MINHQVKCEVQSNVRSAGVALLYGAAVPDLDVPRNEVLGLGAAVDLRLLHAQDVGLLRVDVLHEAILLWER